MKDNGMIGCDIRSRRGFSGTAQGVPLTVESNLTDPAGGGAGFAGVVVYLSQATATAGLLVIGSRRGLELPALSAER